MDPTPLPTSQPVTTPPASLSDRFAEAAQVSMPTGHFSHRLAKHADYQQVYRAGRKQFGKQMMYFYLLRPGNRRQDALGPRIGLTVPKALGKAVDRNRIKRRMRAAVRSALPRLTAPVDVVLHPRRSVIDLEFAQLQRELATLFGSIQAACERNERPGETASSVASPRYAPRGPRQDSSQRSPQARTRPPGQNPRP